MDADNFFHLERQPLDLDESDPGNQFGLPGCSPPESALGSSTTAAAYETVFSLERISLDTPDSVPEGGVSELSDLEYIAVERLFDGSAHETVFALQRTPLDASVGEEEKGTPELPAEEYMGPEMFSDGDAYRAVFSLSRMPLEVPQKPSRKRELAPLLGKPSTRLSEAEKGLMKRTRQRNLAEIARAMAQTGHFRYIEKRLYQFRSPCWTMVDDEDVEDYLREEISSIFPEVVDYLSSASLVEIYRQLRGQLPREKRSELDPDNQYYLCCTDGLYQISDGTILPPDPGLNLFSYLNVRASDIGCGDGYYTEMFLDNATDGDPALRDRLLEMIAAILTAIPLKKFFFLEGPGDTGKGQLLQFLRHLLGTSSCCSITSINDLAENWSTGDLIDKLMCCCPDIPDEPLTKKTIGIIKQLAGDDAIKGKRKYKEAVTFDCDAKLVFASNSPLKIRRHRGEEAFFKRLVYIPFHNSVPDEKKVPNLYRHLLDEAGYFIGLALKKRNAFMQRNCIFTELTDPECEWEGVRRPPKEERIELFLQQCCEPSSGAISKIQDLYNAFCAYDTSSNEDPIEISRFGELLRHGSIPVEGTRTSTGRCLRGIRLREQNQPTI